MKKIPKVLASSVNPEQLGLTVKGILIGLAPVILVISGLSGWDIGQTDLDQIIEAIISATVAISSAVSAIMILVGAVRKLLVKFGLIK